MNPLRFLLIIAALVIPACAPSRDIRTDEPVDVQTWDGPPCRVIVKVGPEVVLDARSSKPCRLAPPGTF